MRKQHEKVIFSAAFGATPSGPHHHAMQSATLVTD